MILPILLAAAAIQIPPPPAPSKIDCSDADHRAFDFWIGDWDVFATKTDRRIARSRIEKIVGCAISETYDQDLGAGGKPVDYHGRSISAYVPAGGEWRQFYTDNAGTAVTLTGGIRDGAMVFVPGAGPTTNRMTLTARPDGSVTQQGAASTDAGKTWQPTFDFTYRRRAAP